jgi:hypothetical protein
LNDSEVIREKLSDLMKAPFETLEPKSNHPILRFAKPVWFVTCPDGAYHTETVHAQTAWADDQGNLWLESSILAFVSEWVELDHGEEALGPFRKLEPHDLMNPQFREKLAIQFPATMRRVEKFESIVSEISSRRRAQLRMRYDSSISLIGIYLEAKIDANAMDLESKLKAVEINVRAMKEAYEEFELVK